MFNFRNPTKQCAVIKTEITLARRWDGTQILDYNTALPCFIPGQVEMLA